MTTARQYLAFTWVDSRQTVRPSPIQGKGVFAREAIKQGEVVEIIGGRVMTDAEFEAFRQTTATYNAIQIDEGWHLVEHPDRTRARDGSINHACDSNLWLADEVTLVARRDIAAGEELTVDYALFTAQSDWVLDTACRCGSPVCRNTITGEDWKRSDVQARYRDHFSPFINRRIARLNGVTNEP
jgi:uncharacterized protein